MSTILCLETATTNCSVALSINGECVAIKEDYDVKYSHAERLHVYIQEVLAGVYAEQGRSAKADKSQLDAIAVSKGPGSYTGLRIGVSAAKGLCHALDIPLVSIPTLSSLAKQVSLTEDELVIPMLDARRMEVYSAVFNANYDQIRDTQAQVLEETSFAEYLDSGKIHFIGNGVSKFQEICQHPNAVFVEGKLPSAREMCAFAYQRLQDQSIEDVAYFEPYYLKDFVAGTPKKK